MEIRYESMCGMMSALASAKDSNLHFFSIESADWWKTLPADLIPMTGGIYSDRSWEKAVAKRNALVEGKVLGELPFTEVVADRGRFAAAVEVTKSDCGEIRNHLEFSATLLADFDGDGIAELLLEGYRVNKSDNCPLGTGNSLGASFRVLLKKEKPDAQISVLKVPGI